MEHITHDRSCICHDMVVIYGKIKSPEIQVPLYCVCQLLGKPRERAGEIRRENDGFCLCYARHIRLHQRPNPGQAYHDVPPTRPAINTQEKIIFWS